MPQVRCPDCFREMELSQEDLTRVIECSVCEARFGPLVAPPEGQPAFVSPPREKRGREKPSHSPAPTAEASPTHVKCPDCVQSLQITQEQLTQVIACPVCDARIGPVVKPAAKPAFPPPEEPPPEAPPPPPRPRTAGKRVKEKPPTRWIPILLGVFIGLLVTTAMLGATYLVVTRALEERPANTTPAR